MTRPLHTETDVQRGAHPSQEQRRRGYEPRDASPGRVVLGIACFLALMAAGLGFAWATLGWLKARDDQPRDLTHAMAIAPPPPHLLAEPEAVRHGYDAAMDRRMEAPALAHARSEVARQGWQDAASAPSTEATARAHREAGQ
ncbi:hypothetical protein [Sphingobium chungbukense]|uniref:Uncharacterized protein n=1 Tax=Sphingobium chungbukense TaxID=56193 RepID=A0A0M3AQ28_9SPHN|nr:hypothetical protein [Sphingobium chungbukense]KKW90644.1 hypothetical protein YP76_18920 [Sphingobium chungbukense]